MDAEDFVGLMMFIVLAIVVIGAFTAATILAVKFVWWAVLGAIAL